MPVLEEWDELLIVLGSGPQEYLFALLMAVNLDHKGSAGPSWYRMLVTKDKRAVRYLRNLYPLAIDQQVELNLSRVSVQPELSHE